MAYIRGKGELVGVFTFEEIRQGKHTAVIAEAKEKTGLQHSFSEYLCENCVPVGLKIYLCATVDAR